MSPLWKSRIIKKLKQKTIQKRPSPKHNSDNQIYAQCDTIKGTSLFTSLSRRMKASMTVEAAVLLPLFLFVFLNMGCAIELIRLHCNLEFALCDIGNRMSVYGYALSQTERKVEKKEEEKWEELQDIAFSYTYIKNEIIECVGRQYLEEAPLVGGVDGLRFLESEIFGQNDYFEIIVTYQATPYSTIAGFRPFRMANRYYGHLWNGYHIPGTDEDNMGDIVYVAENGRVYHEDRNCSYLVLSIREVSLQKAYESRNLSGEKYQPCELCRSNEKKGTVYITDDGNRIHYNRNCAGLKRTIYTLHRTKVKKYQPCSRCARNNLGR